jgi:hypothetical protein
METSAASTLIRPRAHTPLEASLGLPGCWRAPRFALFAANDRMTESSKLPGARAANRYLVR